MVTLAGHEPAIRQMPYPLGYLTLTWIAHSCSKMSKNETR